MPEIPIVLELVNGYHLPVSLAHPSPEIQFHVADGKDIRIWTFEHRPGLIDGKPIYRLTGVRLVTG